MTIAVVRITLELPAETLKEKRAIVKSVIARLRNQFNAAVAEVGALDDPGAAVIAAACVSVDARHADQQVQTIARTVAAWRLDAVVADVETELIPA